MDKIEKIMSEMTLDDKIGQMLCFEFTPLMREGNFDKIEEITKKTKAGSFFVVDLTDPENPKKIAKTREIMEKHLKAPVMVASDVEFGPGSVFCNETSLPWPMSWGACDDPDLIEKAHRATAEICREYGVNWSFAPVVDINMNPDNPVTNVRAISDSADEVAKIGSAAVRGMQYNGLVAAGCKHFPGDGVDDRNQHFCTTVNSLSKEEWMNTFGKVYKEMFKAGAASVMVAHIALPAYDEKLNDWLGYPPASLSYNLQTKLLKGELGFDGCIVSDAMSMIGVSAAIHPDDVAVEFVKAGGDVILFPLVEYFDQIKEAVLSGEISMERIDDAVRRVLKLKERARLFEDEKEVLKDITHQYDIKALASEIAEKSITVIRNYDNCLPAKVKKGDKILMINLQKPGKGSLISYSMDTMEEELKRRGFEVKSYINPDRATIEEDMKTAALVLVNIKLSCRESNAASLRIYGENVSCLWRGALLRHPNCIFASFGDPYKIYDFPYLKNYINVYSATPESQIAYIKAIFGEIPIVGKSPVELKGFFEREV